MSDVTRRQGSGSRYLVESGASAYIAPGADLDIYGDVTIGNDGHRGIGAVSVEDGATLTFESGASLTLESGASLTLESGSLLTLEGELAREKPANLAGSLLGLLPQHYSIDPDAVSATATHAAVTLGAAAQDVTTAITNPDFPRNVTVKGNAAEIAGDVVIEGTNVLGAEITETIALDGSTEVPGTLAFASVTKISLPAKTNESGDTVSVGIGKKFGLPHIVYNAGFLLVKLFDGSADTGTLAVDADEIEKNLFALNGTPNGAKILDLVYLT